MLFVSCHTQYIRLLLSGGTDDKQNNFKCSLSRGHWFLACTVPFSRLFFQIGIQMFFATFPVTVTAIPSISVAGLVINTAGPPICYGKCQVSFHSSNWGDFLLGEMEKTQLLGCS